MLTLSLERELIAMAENAVNLRRFGVLGNNTKVETAAIQDAVDAAIAGPGILYIPRTATGYLINDAITVTDSLIVISNGAQIRQGTSGKALFACSGSFEGLEFHGLRLIGEHDTSATSLDLTEIAISIDATSAANDIEDIVIADCFIRGFGGYGVLAQYVKNFKAVRNTIRNIHYAGIMGSSAIGGTISYNDIDGINGTTAQNAYGISLTRKGDVTSLVTDPRSSDITVLGNSIRNIPEWEGIDTHSGKNLTIAGNTIRNTHIGINVSRSTDDSGDPYLAPVDVTVADNTIDSEQTDFSRSWGIVFGGSLGTGAAGSPESLAMGTIVGNTISRHGDGTTGGGGSGGILCQMTQGLTVNGNRCLECSPYGVVFYFDNYDFSACGNTGTDIFVPSGGGSNSSLFAVRSEYNYGSFAGNSCGTAGVNSRGAPSGGSINNGMFNIATATNNRLVIGRNYPRGTSAANGVIGSGVAGACDGLELFASATYDPPSLAAGASAVTTVSVTHASIGDFVDVSFSLDLQEITVTGYVQAANTVEVVFANENASGSPVDLASGTLYVRVVKRN